MEKCFFTNLEDNYGQMTACKHAELFSYSLNVFMKSTLCADCQCYDQSSVFTLSVCQTLEGTHLHSLKTLSITEVTKGASYVTGCGSAGLKNITHICPSYENTEGQAVIVIPEFWMWGFNLILPDLDVQNQASWTDNCISLSTKAVYFKHLKAQLMFVRIVALRINIKWALASFNHRMSVCIQHWHYFVFLTTFTFNYCSGIKSFYFWELNDASVTNIWSQTSLFLKKAQCLRMWPCSLLYDVHLDISNLFEKHTIETDKTHAPYY